MSDIVPHACREVTNLLRDKQLLDRQLDGLRVGVSVIFENADRDIVQIDAEVE